MRARKATIALCALTALLLPVAAAQGATGAPAWQISSTSLPSNFTPGAAGTNQTGPQFLLLATNVGGEKTTGSVTIKDTLPTGLTVASAPGCTVAEPIVTCAFPGTVNPGENLEVKIAVNVAAVPPASLVNQASVSGGGAADATVQTTTPASATPIPFGFLAGFSAPFTQEDGSAATLAGSHPYQLTANLGFPTEKTVNGLGGAGHLRDTRIDFPPGEIIDPAATPELCTEAELTSEGDPECPAASQVGTVDLITVVGVPEASTAALYNMVPPPGMAASLGFDAAGVGIFVHLSGEVRSDGDYGLSGGTADALALTAHPVFGAQVQLWGDPSAKSHDEIREGDANPPCLSNEPCEVPAQNTAFLTRPAHCPGQATTTIGNADSWEAPGDFKQASYESADLSGSAAILQGCGTLDFKPAIEAKPTTNLTDSPTGLDIHLRQPQQNRLDGRSPAPLKDITLNLAPGLVVNPASADGQEACSAAQIGLITPIGQTPIHFSKAPAACPDAAKIGTVEVTTPLLAQIDAEAGKVLQDPQGNPIPRPVSGSVYLAKPFDNPFGSLLAVYFSVEDPTSGTVAKFAARIQGDPVTGQLSSRVIESPQLPLADVHLHIFPGARAPLRTPLACGVNTSSAAMTPWSSPEGLDATSTDAFATTAAPGGGPCPTSGAAAPHQPSFVAGTLAPKAGAFSPLTAKLGREDGSQPLAGFEVTLPPGLSARLAGVPYCSEPQIAQAQGRDKPNEGALELADPSCPAASQLGTLDVGSGAGPSPLHTPGRIYLAGPYKGAPLSVVTIVPALAGPFDLGVVAVRAALYLDPTTAQGRTVSDPLPQILDGIPLDVRSVAISIDRPDFTLNPTSCNPTSAVAAVTSAFGQVASLSSRFQVGGCKSLPYKPKLTTHLFGPIHRGGHPRFRTIFTAKRGEANTKRIVLALPKSEFIDQAHFRTICTRVQFAAKQCPAGSIYGNVKATSPLLDYPLQGPIYLRSSSHELPDAVFALHGPPSQPIEVDVAARIDSVNGGLRATINSLPDAPITKAIVTMQGAKKGLFQNSTNICKGTHRATLKLDGQNGKPYDTRPLMQAQCPKHAKKKAKHGGRQH